MKKRLFICFLAFLTIFMALNLKIYCFEEDENENFEYSEIQKVIQTASGVSNLPDTSSKHIIAIDRDSKRILYEKDAFSRNSYGINYENSHFHYCN